VVLANEDFVELAKVVAKSKGVSVLPYVVFPRKINEMTPEEIEELTGRAIGEIVDLLKAGT
jgi:hypothetical protein